MDEQSQQHPPILIVLDRVFLSADDAARYAHERVGRRRVSASTHQPDKKQSAERRRGHANRQSSGAIRRCAVSQILF